MEEIPTLLDISPTNGLNLDEADAVEHFLGKTKEEAALLFADGLLCYMEDMMWMGKKAYFYYLGAVEIYLHSIDGTEDTECVSSLIDSVIHFRAECDPEEFIEGSDILHPILTYCLDNFDRFFDKDDEYDHYDDYYKQLTQLLQYLAEIKEHGSSDTFRSFQLKQLRKSVVPTDGIPTLEEIAPSGGETPQEFKAVKDLYGLTRQKAESLFYTPLLYFGKSYLSVIGPKAFAYYFPAIKPYLQSDASEGNESLVNTIREVIQHRLRTDPVSVALCKNEVLQMLIYIRDYYDKFFETDGSFTRLVLGATGMPQEHLDQINEWRKEFAEDNKEHVDSGFVDNISKELREQFKARRPLIDDLITRVEALPHPPP